MLLVGPGILNLGTHGSARCLFSPSLDTRLIPHDYNENKMRVHACMETAKPVIWVRGCELSRSMRTIHLSGGFSAKGSVQNNRNLLEHLSVARQDCSPRVSTRSLASKRKSSLAAKRLAL